MTDPMAETRVLEIIKERVAAHIERYADHARTLRDESEDQAAYCLVIRQLLIGAAEAMELARPSRARPAERGSASPGQLETIFYADALAYGNLAYILWGQGHSALSLRLRAVRKSILELAQKRGP